MNSPSRRPAGMAAFTIVWLGQMVSLVATQMTQFALTIWAFEKTGQATTLALVQVFFITPFLLMSPVAGLMVDRYNRKLMMMVSDLGAGAATVAILALQWAGGLEIWHLYAAAAVTGTFSTFQWPAYSASISLMVPKQQLGRANGMMSLTESGPGVLAPLLAGALLGVIGLTGILLIDVATLALAVGALLIVAVPQPPRTAEGDQSRGGFVREAAYGFRYILARPSLLGLQLVFFWGNLFYSIGTTLLPPMVLARTGNNELIFGTVQSAGAIGGVIGGLAMSAWGGFRRRVHGVLLGWIVTGVAGLILLGLGQGLALWIPAMVLGQSVGPLVNGSNQAIWQAKVAPDVQGRVFSARRLIAWLTNPISPLIAGVLADQAMEPAMVAGGSLAGTFGWLTGVGPGAGMALILIAAGALATLTGAAGYLFPAVRDAEDLLPDHDALPAAGD